MALVNKAFSVSVVPGMMPPIVHVSEYDIGRAYTVSIIDEQGNPFTIPSGTTASIEGTLNGKVGFTQSASISNNQVSFTLSQSMTAYSGKAWCKIKLTQNSQPIQTCAFILAVDRAGVEAETVIGAPGFQEQINEGIAEYFDNDPPFFELPEGGQRGQALFSDGNGDAYWGDVQSGGTGLSDDAKAALLACFRNVAWIGSDGQDYYDDLYDALYPPAPPATLLSISAAFNQGGHTVYDTDSLDSLKQYLTVTARYDNGTVQTVTAYTLSGTLAEGTSTITVSYGGKNTTFTVTVTHDEVISGKFTATGTRTAGEYHLCALIANENIDQGSEIAFEVSGTNWTIDPTVGGNAQYYFGDDSGEVGNGLFNGAGPQGTGYTKTGSNGAYSIVRSCSYSTVMNTPYLKFIIRIGSPTIPFSFDISTIKVTIGGTDRKVIAFGGFFAQETYTIT